MSNQDPTQDALRALGRRLHHEFGHDYGDHAAQMPDEPADPQGQVLDTVSDAGVERVVRFLSAQLAELDTEQQLAALWLMGELRDPLVVEPLVRIIQDRSLSSNLREAAAYRLVANYDSNDTKLNDALTSRAVGPLVQVAQDHEDVGDVRRAAIEALGSLCGVRALRELFAHTAMVSGLLIA